MCFIYFTHEAAGASGARHSLRPLLFEGRDSCKPRTHRAARMRSHTQPSLPAKAGDPVFRGASDGIERPQRTGYPACAGMTAKNSFSCLKIESEGTPAAPCRPLSELALVLNVSRWQRRTNHEGDCFASQYSRLSVPPRKPPVCAIAARHRPAPRLAPPLTPASTPVLPTPTPKPTARKGPATTKVRYKKSVRNER